MIGNLYIIRNTVNDKVYIGKTYNSIEHRFKEHKRDAKKLSDCKFYHAINKHGIDNFYIELLGQFEEGILEEKEIEYIAKYDSYHNGYNSTLGGGGTRTLELDDEVVVKEWEKNDNINETARMFNVSSQTITKILVSKGVYSIGNAYEKIPFVMYDKLWNRVKIFESRTELSLYIENELNMKLQYTFCQRIDNACDNSVNIAFDHHWQKHNDLFLDDKEFNSKYDKESYQNNQELICINDIWFVKERDGLVLNIETGKYEKLEKKIVNRTIRPEKEILENFRPFTVKDIAEYYNVKEKTVRTWFQYYKLDLPNKVKKEQLENEFSEDILNLFMSGKGTAKIASILSIPETIVDKVVKDLERPIKSVHIEKYDLDGHLIGIFTTLTDAAKSVDRIQSGDKIRLCINGKRKTAFGYVWKGQL